MNRLLLLCALVVSSWGHSAELMKKSDKKAVMNFTKDELVDLEVGDTVRLVATDGKRFKFRVQQIDYNAVTLTGPKLELLSTDDVYRIIGVTAEQPEEAFPKPRTQLAMQESFGETYPVYVSIGVGRRWSDFGDTSNQANAVDLKLGYAFQSLPATLGVYYLGYNPILNDEFLSKNDLQGGDLGIYTELTHRFGPLRPYLGGRFMLNGAMVGTIESTRYDSEAGIVTSRAEFATVYKPAVNLEVGVEVFFSPKFAVYASAMKGAKQNGRGSSRLLLLSSREGQSFGLEGENKIKESYDQFLLGVTLFGLSY